LRTGEATWLIERASTFASSAPGMVLDRDSSSRVHIKLDDDLLNRVSFNWTTRERA
jgi:hypothetical protein